MQWLTIRRLELADIPSAFPLMRLHYQGLSLARWTNYARSILAGGQGTIVQGFLAAFDSQGVIHGVLQYERRYDVDGRFQMVATDLVACGLFKQHHIRIIKALSQCLSRMAKEYGCEQVGFEVSEGDQFAPLGSLPSLLATFGHHAMLATVPKWS